MKIIKIVFKSYRLDQAMWNYKFMLNDIYWKHAFFSFIFSQMVGVEYILLHAQEPILYIIRKQQRQSPTQGVIVYWFQYEVCIKSTSLELLFVFVMVKLLKHWQMKENVTVLFKCSRI